MSPSIPKVLIIMAVGVPPFQSLYYTSFSCNGFEVYTMQAKEVRTPISQRIRRTQLMRACTTNFSNHLHICAPFWHVSFLAAVSWSDRTNSGDYILYSLFHRHWDQVGLFSHACTARYAYTKGLSSDGSYHRLAGSRVVGLSKIAPARS